MIKIINNLDVPAGFATGGMLLLAGPVNPIVGCVGAAIILVTFRMWVRKTRLPFPRI